jgi:hypothetical protein
MDYIEISEIRLIDVSRIDYTDISDIKYAVTVILNNLTTLSHRSDQYRTEYIKIYQILTNKVFASHGLTIKEIEAIFNLSSSKFIRSTRRLFKIYGNDIERLESAMKASGHYSLEKFALKTKNSGVSQEAYIELLTKRLPLWATQLIKAVKEVTENRKNFPIEWVVLQKVQRHLNWYLPEFKPLDADEYFQYSYCTSCGNPSIGESLAMVEYVGLGEDRKCLMPICRVCETVHAHPKKDYVMQMLYDYASKLEAILDESNENIKKHSKQTTHFNRAYNVILTHLKDKR